MGSAIVWGLGVLLVLALIFLAAFVVRSRRRTQKANFELDDAHAALEKAFDWENDLEAVTQDWLSTQQSDIAEAEQIGGLSWRDQWRYDELMRHRQMRDEIKALKLPQDEEAVRLEAVDRLEAQRLRGGPPSPPPPPMDWDKWRREDAQRQAQLAAWERYNARNSAWLRSQGVPPPRRRRRY